MGFQNRALKSLLGCTRDTSPAIVRLFCGVEPIACRIDILKLRYYWRLTRLQREGGILPKVFHMRKGNVLGTDKGYCHEALDLCCKYKMIDIWHGRLGEWSVNGANLPHKFIKQKVTAYYLRRDLEDGRRRNCAFTKMFLENVFSYQAVYRIPDPFCSPDFEGWKRARGQLSRVFLCHSV